MARSLRFLLSSAPCAALVLAAAGALGCQTTPTIPGRNVELIEAGDRLVALNPADIAVVPVRTAVGVTDVPETTLRRAAQRGLAVRRYSPLSIDLVDETVAGIGSGGAASGTQEASYQPGVLGEDAVFEVLVLEWDTSAWDLQRTIKVTVEARMLDPRRPMGAPLWAARVSQPFNAAGEVGPVAGSTKTLEALCFKVFRELLSRMPERNPDPDVDPALDPEPLDAGPEGNPEGELYFEDDSADAGSGAASAA